MNKVLVEVYVPSINELYDVYLPLESTVGEIGVLLANAISDLSDNKYMQRKNVSICSYLTGKEYEKNLRLYETNIDNGTKIMIT